MHKYLKMQELNPFADRLQDLLASSDKSLSSLASEIGVPSGSLSTYQNNGREAGIISLKRIAKYFNVSADWLLGLSDTKHVEDSDIPNKTGLTPQAVETLIHISSDPIYDLANEPQARMSYDSAICREELSILNELISRMLSKNGTGALLQAMNKYLLVDWYFDANQESETIISNFRINPDISWDVLETVRLIYVDQTSRGKAGLNRSEIKRLFFNQIQVELIKLQERLSKEREEVQNNGKE